MKALKLITVLVLTSTVAFAQKTHVETASIAIDKYLKRTDASAEIRSEYLQEAKEYIDKAHLNETTNNYSKMWLVRGKVYCSIYLDTLGNKDLDKDAIEKSLQSLLACKATDEKKKYKDDMNAYLAAATYYAYYEGNVATARKEYDRAMRYYEASIAAVPENDEAALKRFNIDQNKVKRSAAYTSFDQGNSEKCIQLMKELISDSYADPTLYGNLATLLLKEKDTSGAIKYITMGRNLYEDNKGLIATELNLYLELNKPNVLIERLTAAIDSDPYNEQYFFNRGSLYQKISRKAAQDGDDKRVNELENLAIADYEKAIEINSEYGDALYNLGALYVDRGSGFSNKANNYGLNEKTKTDAALKEAETYYKKAVPYLELAFEIDEENKSLMQVLLQLYLRMEDTEKYKALKAKAGQ
jgi:tetratricopeptide (TPR) repeat protein